MTKRKWGRRAFGLALAVIGGGCGKEVPTSDQVSGTTHCIRYYATCIDPIFHKTLAPSGQSCSGQGLGCHVIIDTGSGTQEGSGGQFKVRRFPTTDTELTQNFISAHNKALSGSSSLLLRKPMADGVTHPPGQVFASTNDSDFLQLKFWVETIADTQGDLNPLLDTAQCSAMFVSGNTCRTFP